MNSLDALYEKLAKDEYVSNDVDEEIDASSWLATCSEQTDTKKTKSTLKISDTKPASIGSWNYDTSEVQVTLMAMGLYFYFQKISEAKPLFSSN